jgi:hypothetical protein
MTNNAAGLLSLANQGLSEIQAGLEGGRKEFFKVISWG